jgi:hypothetical protein
MIKSALKGQNLIAMGAAHRIKYGKNNISPEGVKLEIKGERIKKHTSNHRSDYR